MKNLLVIFLLSAPLFLGASDKKSLTKKSSSRKGLYSSLSDLPSLAANDTNLDYNPVEVAGSYDEIMKLVQLIRLKNPMQQELSLRLQTRSISCSKNIEQARKPAAPQNAENLATKKAERLRVLRESQELLSDQARLIAQQQESLTQMLLIINRIYTQQQ